MCFDSETADVSLIVALFNSVLFSVIGTAVYVSKFSDSKINVLSGASSKTFSSNAVSIK